MSTNTKRKDALRDILIQSVLQRFDADSTRRKEALQEFMSVTMPTIEDGSATSIASLIPELPLSLYESWASLFADRLVETLPQQQLEELCSGTDEANTTVALVYLMFMESERMEKQIAKDLHALGMTMGSVDAVGNALGSYLRARLSAQKETPEQ